MDGKAPWKARKTKVNHRTASPWLFWKGQTCSSTLRKGTVYKPVRHKRLVNVLGIKLNKRCSLFREVSLFSHLLLNTISSLSAGIIFWRKGRSHEFAPVIRPKERSRNKTNKFLIPVNQHVKRILCKKIYIKIKLTWSQCRILLLLNLELSNRKRFPCLHNLI